MGTLLVLSMVPVMEKCRCFLVDGVEGSRWFICEICWLVGKILVVEVRGNQVRSYRRRSITKRFRNLLHGALRCNRESLPERGTDYVRSFPPLRPSHVRSDSAAVIGFNALSQSVAFSSINIQW